MQVRTVLAIGAWGVLGILALGQGPSQKVAPKPMSPDERIEGLQKGFQAAVENLNMADLRSITSLDENGKQVKIRVPKTFVVRRVPTFSILHDSTLRDTEVPAFVPTPGVQLDFWAVSSRGKPLLPGKMTLHVDTATDFPMVMPAQKKAIEAFASAALPALADKDVYTGQIEGNDAQARPLRLSKPECMSCHPGAKLKDPAAIMVYVMKKIAPRK